MPWNENTQSGIFRNRPTRCTCELNLRNQPTRCTCELNLRNRHEFFAYGREMSIGLSKYGNSGIIDP